MFFGESLLKNKQRTSESITFTYNINIECRLSIGSHSSTFLPIKIFNSKQLTRLKMKRYIVIYIFLLLTGCDSDLSNQHTPIEGYVTDYYTDEPISGVPILVTNHFNPFLGEGGTYFLDTLTTSTKGYYFFEFYNDSDRYYTVEPLFSEYYYSSKAIIIDEGENNSINFSLKPFNMLNIKFIKYDSFFTTVRIYNYQTDISVYGNLYGQDTILKTKLVREEKKQI